MNKFGFDKVHLEQIRRTPYHVTSQSFFFCLKSSATIRVFFFVIGSSSLRSLCEENVHTLLSSLPRLIMRTADDSKKLQTLNLVVGYLSLLGRSVCVLLNSAALLKRLSLALIQVDTSYIVFCSVLSVPINLLFLVIFTIKITF